MPLKVWTRGGREDRLILKVRTNLGNIWERSGKSIEKDWTESAERVEESARVAKAVLEWG